MPLSHAIPRAQKEALLRLLQARAANLQRGLASVLHESRARGEPGLPNRHLETDDDAVAEEETALDIASVERDARELNDVYEAIARIDAGSYGACVDCGDDIPWARLQAQPHAKRCIACASAAERARPR